jgi:hypothetical protein
MCRPFARSYSIFAYLYKSRSKKYLISIHELLQQDKLNVNGVRNFQYWLQKWNFPERAILALHYLPGIPRSVSSQALPYKNGSLNLLEKILVCWISIMRTALAAIRRNFILAFIGEERCGACQICDGDAPAHGILSHGSMCG